MRKELLSARECSALYGCGQSTWWHWCKQGRVPRPVHIGRLTRWRLSELERHMDSLSAPSAVPS
jgi:predicted DNA-binding transcriptional regulator AlpA